MIYTILMGYSKFSLHYIHRTFRGTVGKPEIFGTFSRYEWFP